MRNRYLWEVEAYNTDEVFLILTRTPNLVMAARKAKVVIAEAGKRDGNKTPYKPKSLTRAGTIDKFLWLILSLALATPAFAQSSQTMNADFMVIKHNVQVCMDDYRYWKRQGKPVPTLSREQLTDYCIKRAIARYRERVQIEERLIEGLTKECCPNVQTPPATPHYREKQEYKDVQRPQGREREEIEQIIAKLKESAE